MTDGSTSGRRRWRGALAVIVVVLVLGAIVAAHLAGLIGPGSHDR